MGTGRPVPDVADRGSRPARAQLARSVQRPALHPQDRCALALDTQRPAAVYQQAQRWLAAGCFEALADDLRAVLRLAAGRTA